MNTCSLKNVLLNKTERNGNVLELQVTVTVRLCVYDANVKNNESCVVTRVFGARVMHYQHDRWIF